MTEHEDPVKEVESYENLDRLDRDLIETGLLRMANAIGRFLSSVETTGREGHKDHTSLIADRTRLNKGVRSRPLPPHLPRRPARGHSRPASPTP